MCNNNRHVSAPETDEPVISRGLVIQVLTELLAEPEETSSPVSANIDFDEIHRIVAARQTDEERGKDKRNAEEMIRMLEAGVCASKPAEAQRELSTVCAKDDETMGVSNEINSDANPIEDRPAETNDDTVEDEPQRLRFHFKYRREAELGRGGQGVVYLVEGEDSFSASRALKIFRPTGYDSDASFQADMERIRRVAKLIHHAPHDDLVDIAWFGRHHSNFALLMQYIDGFDLRHLLQPDLMPRLKEAVNENRWKTINSVVYSEHRHQLLALQPAIAVYIIERVLRGLSALHSRGIVHGDIKPSNIMMNAWGGVKIIDIGSAFEVSAPPREYFVTPAYAAPEFLERREMTIQSDLASVGYVLIELLSGRSITDSPRQPDETTRTIGGLREKQLIDLKFDLPNRLTEILPRKILGSKYLFELCRRLIDPDPQKRFLDANDSIVDPEGGTYAFHRDLILANLAVCNFHEAVHWLMDVKLATALMTERTAMPH